MALCTQSDVETFLQVAADTIDTDLADQLIEEAQAVIELEVRHELEDAARTATLDGRGGDTLYLPVWPVTSITSVTEDGDALVEDTDFFSYTDGRLVRASAGTAKPWVRKLKAIEVSYQGGYTTVPHDIRGVCIRMVARAYQAGLAFAQTKDSVGVRQETIDNYSVTYGSAAGDVASAAIMLIDSEKAQLTPYRRRRSSVRVR